MGNDLADLPTGSGDYTPSSQPLCKEFLPTQIYNPPIISTLPIKLYLNNCFYTYNKRDPIS